MLHDSGLLLLVLEVGHVAMPLQRIAPICARLLRF